MLRHAVADRVSVWLTAYERMISGCSGLTLFIREGERMMEGLET